MKINGNGYLDAKIKVGMYSWLLGSPKVRERARHVS